MPKKPQPKDEPEVAAKKSKAAKEPSSLDKLRALRARAGRPNYAPTEEDRTLCLDFASVGMPQARIAAHFSISEPTLRKHFNDELHAGADFATTMAIKNGLLAQAMQGNVTAAIFIAKTRMGWREQPTQMELTGKDGAPLEADKKAELVDKVLGIIDSANARAEAAQQAAEKTKH